MRRNPSTRMTMLLNVAVLCVLVPLEAQERATDDFVPVTDAMLRAPDPGDWLMVHWTYDHHAYSPLDQINRENVGNLQLAWMRAMDNEGPQQLRPLVYDGVMYIANPGSEPSAGAGRYDWRSHLGLSEGPSNRPSGVRPDRKPHA